MHKVSVTLTWKQSLSKVHTLNSFSQVKEFRLLGVKINYNLTDTKLYLSALLNQVLLLTAQMCGYDLHNHYKKVKQDACEGDSGGPMTILGTLYLYITLLQITGGLQSD